jgi:hypothetical protein
MAPPPDPSGGDDGQPSRPEWQHVETLEVTQVVLAILKARKTMPWATAAVVSRERRGDVTYVRVTMLRDSPPRPGQPAAGPNQPDQQQASGTAQLAAAFAVHRLGDDLASAFGTSDVITLK